MSESDAIDDTWEEFFGKSFNSMCVCFYFRTDSCYCMIGVRVNVLILIYLF